MSLYDGSDLSFRTTLGFNKSQTEHRNTINGNHPENEGRIGAIRNLLNKSGLLSKCNVVEDFLPIDKEDIAQSHDSDYVTSIFNEESTSDQYKLNTLCSKFDSVFMSPGSIPAAKEAAACCRFVAELIMEDKVPNGMCIVRPPGHHADRSEACGFSIFNNTAQAAEAAFNYGADRILIVDLDVHHGQGTQRIFYDDKRVLYFSIHRYENGNYWPHLRESQFDYIGDGEGRGYNINVPLNETGCGDADYLTAFWHVLWPVALSFNPNFVIVSAGFDSCNGDPLGGMNLTPSCYSHLVYQLKALAKGKLLIVLEGGYNHDVSAFAAAQCIRVLTGECPLSMEKLVHPRESTITSCLNVIAMLRNCWSCFDFYNMRSGTRSSAWENFSPEVVFNPQPIEERANTGDIHQNELLKIEWTISEEAPSSTMLIYDTTSDGHHDTADVNHPEKPQRTQRILAALKSTGVFDRCLCVENSRVATNEELEAAHERQYVQRMHRTEKMTPEELQREADRLDSIFLTNETFRIAARTAGAVLECVDRVCEAPIGSLNAFAVVRPPGHHAGPEKPSGFCIFNNVAVAAHYAMSKYGYKRILILDWDVHHGNGTQEIFYDDNRVLYMSLHRHEGGYFYPLGEPKDVYDVGVDAGAGFNVNVPWSYAKMGDEEYRQAFAKIIMPIAYEFNPELVFISAGFDAAKGDPLGEYKVLPSTFALMTHQLSGLAGGRCIAVLEGGYNLDSISAAAVSVCETLQSRSCKVVLREEIEEFAVERPKLHPDAWISLRKAASVQEKHWTMLKGLQKHLGEVLNSPFVKKGRRKAATTNKKLTPSKVAPGVDVLTPRRSPRVAVQKASKNNDIDDLEKAMSSLSTNALDSQAHYISLQVPGEHDHECDDNIPSSSSSESQAGEVESLLVALEAEENATISEMDNKENRPPDAGGSSSSGSSNAPGSSGTSSAASTTQVHADVADALYAVVPLATCPHLEQVNAVPASGIDSKAQCTTCGIQAEVWICLTCYQANCGRFVHGHSVTHTLESSHPMALSMADLSVWCYTCDAYVHNETLIPAKSAAHLHKFGEHMPA